MSRLRPICGGLLALALVWCGLTEAVQLFARAYFRTRVDGDWFLILLASDARETLTFLSLYDLPLLACGGVALTGLVLAALSLFLLRRSRRGWRLLAAAFALYAAVGLLREGRAWTPLYLAYDTARGLGDYVALLDAARWTAADEDAARAAAARAETARLPTRVLVIGESLTPSRMGIYGYARDTTPQLAALATNGLAVLPPRKVRFGYTAQALRDLLVRDGVSLVRRRRREGYHPVLVSAQAHWERYCGVEMTVFAACERKRYLGEEADGAPASDLALVARVREELRAAPRPLFLIVHLIGSHFPYAERVPADWSRPEGFDDYDMSVRVTDRVVTEIIRALPPDAELVFTSDHGESPNSDKCRDFSDPDVFRVPLLAYPERVARHLKPMSL